MVSRAGLWLILKRHGCPQNILQMVIQLHESQRDRTRHNGDLSEPFPITKGVQQGCVQAPTLFNFIFSMMLKQATDDLDDEDGVHVRYHMDGSPFNQRHLQAYTKTQERLIRDLVNHTQSKRCSVPHLALRVPCCCLALTSASRKPAYP